MILPAGLAVAHTLLQPESVRGKDCLRSYLRNGAQIESFNRNTALG